MLMFSLLMGIMMTNSLFITLLFLVFHFPTDQYLSLPASPTTQKGSAVHLKQVPAPSGSRKGTEMTQFTLYE